MAVELSKTNVNLFEDQMDWLYHHGIGMQTFKTRGGRLWIVLCKVGELHANLDQYCRDNGLAIQEWIGQNLVTMSWKMFDNRFALLEGLRLVAGQDSFRTWGLYSNIDWPNDVLVTSESYERLALENLIQLRTVDRKLAPDFLFRQDVYRHWNELMRDGKLKQRLPRIKNDDENLWKKCHLFESTS